MGKPVVTTGCMVTLTPGAAGPPDTGVILQIPQTAATVGGLPIAVAGSLCQMVNSVSGAPYVLPIGPLGSTGMKINGMAVVRLGDQIPTPPGVMAILGPPAGPTPTDSAPP